MRPRRPEERRRRQPPLRVALVCGRPSAELDGVAGYVERLADELPAAGVDPVVVPCGPDVRGAAAAGRALAKLDLDAVHVQFAPSMYGFRGSIGLLPLGLPRSVPLLATLHEYGSWELPIARPRPLQGLYPWSERRAVLDRETGFLVPRSRAVVVTNPLHLATLQSRFHGRVPARHIPIGANVEVDREAARDESREQIRRQLGLDPGSTLLAFFGFVHPVKGLRYLLEAIAQLRDQGEELHLAVVGGFESLALPGREASDFRSELEGRVRELRLEGQVTFTGFQPPAEVSRWLLASDLGVLPFTAGVTTKSGSLLTMFAHELPVVATAGEDESIEGGETCIAVPSVRDAEALAHGVRRALHDDGLRRRVARRGKALADRHSWPDIARRHADLYQEAAG
ncbi:glycosyltransferase family 4 protein [Sinomonas terrae]|uniref:Glycosyltransferase family 4 protein n=1 Tax=Sinomonas terrae TaxID=2908838 RepID=A0ABS9TW73_9MICC|nr:glycosyltransferase family 4 protein [Sinomonas terrae]MCH6468615.1 glycosyltransferase family 4 protein [Sinomonas terrae]